MLFPHDNCQVFRLFQSESVNCHVTSPTRAAYSALLKASRSLWRPLRPTGGTARRAGLPTTSMEDQRHSRSASPSPSLSSMSERSEDDVTEPRIPCRSASEGKEKQQEGRAMATLDRKVPSPEAFLGKPWSIWIDAAKIHCSDSKNTAPSAWPSAV